MIIRRFLALIGDISLNHVPVSSFADCCDTISFRPQVSSPKLSLDMWMFEKELSCDDAFHDLDNLGRRELWGGREKVVDVIEIYAHPFKGYLVSLFDFCTYRMHGLFAVRKTEYPLSILYRCYEVVVYLVRTTLGFPDRSHTLMIFLKVTDQQAGSELAS